MQITWLPAYLLTQAIEVPIYLCAARHLGQRRRWLYAVGASTLTHPVLWFLFPWSAAPYVPVLVVAECFALVTEAAWGRWLGVRRPWLWSAAANSASLLAGLVMNGLK